MINLMFINALFRVTFIFAVFVIILFLIIFTMENIFSPQTTNKNSLIKNLYLYLVSFVALMMIVFSAVDIINIILRTYVFTKADGIYYYPEVPCTQPALNVDGTPPSTPPVDCQKLREENKRQIMENNAAQRERDLVRDISFIVVGIPLFIFHWNLIRKRDF